MKRRTILLLYISLFGSISYLFSHYITVGDVYHYFRVPEIRSVQFDYFNFSNGNGKLVMLWTPHWGVSGSDAWGVKENSLDGCSVKCDFTSEKSLLEKSDVLMFSSNWDVYFQAPMPKYRRADQLYVYFWHESPGYSYLTLSRWKNFFNLTMTYRRDADIYNPYGRFHQLQKGESQEMETVENVKKKKKLIAWLVSSCNSLSDREGFVEKLQKYFQVDIYGQCGMKCPEDVDCMHYIGQNYKFYLSLENSLCMDYITEKFYNAYACGLIPISYSIGVDQIAPKNSYIDALNFTVEELVEKIKYLDNNIEEYLKYFEWKREFKVSNMFENEWCHLCEVVSRFDKGNQSMYKSYDIEEWWQGTDENPMCVHSPSYYVRLKEFLDFAII